MNFRASLAHLLWHSPLVKPSYGKTLYKWMDKAGTAPDSPFEIDFFGLTYNGNLRNNIDFSIFYYGAFEKPLLFFLRDTLLALPGNEKTFCDIGANIGQHSLFMSQFAKQVHAFEPFQEVRARLEGQVDRNTLTNIHCHPVGLSNNNHALPFYAPTGSNQGIGSFDSSTTSKGNTCIGELQLVKGSDYFEAEGIDNIQLMKIDVEGFEKPALEGLAATIQSQRPVIVCEISYQGEQSFSNIEELKAAFPQDYDFFTFDIRKPDGSKARRHGAKAKRSGQYALIPFQFNSSFGQDDIVACPQELSDLLPRKNPS